ncbi:putative sensor-like histidine kinase YehU [Saccharicrinis fermentans DSM 9555 = JCM 21142]|uniref:Putative sensor-like histidine kinase YehU n=1 Tax=Saccharicrinis fermentans DSM 9555 = JCM 21142 TaxID=869213 RepID=W7YI16_9BACT|nr:putative sensor-like histidine kinase YehU [Saccharicrinis fermentans DSM 9555 = JCM 21142]
MSLYFFLRKDFFLYFASLVILLAFVLFFIKSIGVNPLTGNHTILLESFNTINEKEHTHTYLHINERGNIFLVIALALIGIGTSIKVTASWLNNEKEKNEIKKEKLNAELSYLKSQIDPHFFFNTLNNIYSLAQLKSDKTPQIILKLSELMRYNIYEANKEKVFLKDEINYVQNFIDLQRIRLAKSVDIDYYVRGKIGDKKIEPLIFLPFIENAFKHGIDYTNSCSIDIEISIEEQEITLLVINSTLSRKEKIAQQSGFGLRNIKKRLELLYKNQYTLDISENENKFMVKLTLYLNDH